MRWENTSHGVSLSKTFPFFSFSFFFFKLGLIFRGDFFSATFPFFFSLEQLELEQQLGLEQ